MNGQPPSEPVAAAPLGPLAGLTVLEIAGIGPGPFTGMMLADLGADVIRLDRPDKHNAAAAFASANVVRRNRRSVGINLKDPRGIDVLLRLVDRADVLFEPFRPGVAERLGFGPDVCLARNPRLIYGRLTGWGQEGPLASRAGHDVDYIALAGALHPVGPADRAPTFPLNLLGDFAGGGLLLVVGVLAAVIERTTSGHGQVVDAAMIDGAALLTTMFHALRALGSWNDVRGTNELDGAAPYYRLYEAADGGWLAVGAIEPPFYANLLRVLGLRDAELPGQREFARWPELAAHLEAVFRTRSRDEWAELFADVDACVTPVLSLAEAPLHPHNVYRETFVTVQGVVQPAPAPRFGRTPGSVRWPSPPLGQHTEDVLAEVLGMESAAVGELRHCGVVT
jgi:alpha-methylacyl-CoA racemase